MNKNKKKNKIKRHTSFSWSPLYTQKCPPRKFFKFSAVITIEMKQTRTIITLSNIIACSLNVKKGQNVSKVHSMDDTVSILLYH